MNKLLSEIALKIIQEQTYSIDINKTSVDEIIGMLDQSLLQMLDGYLSDEIPSLENNITKLKVELSNSLGLDRREMPVIKAKQVDQFNKSLKNGEIDIMSPYTKGHLYLPDHFVNNEMGRNWLILGLQDGDLTDDTIHTKLGSTPVNKLHPTQGELWLDVIIDNIERYGLQLDTKSRNATIIVSKDGYILDGHHRWGRQYMLDPTKSLSTLTIPLETNKLLDICRTYGIAIGNKFNN